MCEYRSRLIYFVDVLSQSLCAAHSGQSPFST